MSFDIRSSLFSPDGECDDQVFDAYVDALLREFERSPEFEGLEDAGWIPIVLDYGRGYLGRSAWDLGPAELDEILFELFPRKVSCPASDGSVIIAEVRALLQFMDRVYAKPDAAACMALLDAEGEARLVSYLGDRRRFGMAKTFHVDGQEAGFDMTSERGLQAWMQAHNAALAADRTETRRKVDAQAKARKRRQKAARRKNRKKR